MTTEKRPFVIEEALEGIRHAVAPFAKAAMFALAELGHTSLFEQLIACIISIRTYDEVSLPCARALFALARTPAALAQLSPAQIDAAIAPSTFHEAKSYQIHAIAQQIVQRYDGELPAQAEALLAFKGVGPKCAHLALGIACQLPYISVDIHVHRVTNRWGYVQTPTPEKTLAQLERILPPAYWITINQLLVPFGKHICTGTRPHCSTCPLLSMCQQVGVTHPR